MWNAAHYNTHTHTHARTLSLSHTHTHTRESNLRWPMSDCFLWAWGGAAPISARIWRWGSCWGRCGGVWPRTLGCPPRGVACIASRCCCSGAGFSCTALHRAWCYYYLPTSPPAEACSPHTDKTGCCAARCRRHRCRCWNPWFNNPAVYCFQMLLSGRGGWTRRDQTTIQHIYKKYKWIRSLGSSPRRSTYLPTALTRLNGCRHGGDRRRYTTQLSYGRISRRTKVFMIRCK